MICIETIIFIQDIEKYIYSICKSKFYFSMHEISYLENIPIKSLR